MSEEFRGTHAPKPEIASSLRASEVVLASTRHPAAYALLGLNQHVTGTKYLPGALA
jgi:hypothetical protein